MMRYLFHYIILCVCLISCSSNKEIESSKSISLDEQRKILEKLSSEEVLKTITTVNSENIFSENIKIYDTEKYDSAGNHPVAVEIIRNSSTQIQSETIQDKESTEITEISEESNITSDAQEEIKEVQKQCRSPAYLLIVLALILVVLWRFKL